MGDSGVENGKYEELAQRVARLEGAVGDSRLRREGCHRQPWWIFWVLLWLVIPVFGGFRLHLDDWQPWRTEWPVGILLLVVVVILLARDRGWRGPDQGGKR